MNDKGEFYTRNQITQRNCIECMSKSLKVFAVKSYCLLFYILFLNLLNRMRKREILSLYDD